MWIIYFWNKIGWILNLIGTKWRSFARARTTSCVCANFHVSFVWVSMYEFRRMPIDQCGLNEVLLVVPNVCCCCCWLYAVHCNGICGSNGSNSNNNTTTKASHNTARSHRTVQHRIAQHNTTTHTYAKNEQQQHQVRWLIKGVEKAAYDRYYFHFAIDVLTHRT